MAILNLPDGIRVAGSSPIDADRYHQATIAGRDSLVTVGRAEVGQQVYVDEDETLYILKDATGSGIWEAVGTTSPLDPPGYTGGFIRTSDNNFSGTPLSNGIASFINAEWQSNSFSTIGLAINDSEGVDQTSLINALSGVTTYIIDDANPSNVLECAVSGITPLDPTTVFLSITNASFTENAPVNGVTLIVGATQETPAGPTGTSAGLEKIIEGSTSGWRLVGRDPTYYSNIGLDAVDFSTSETTSDTLGAGGNYSFAEGYETYASGEASHAEGIFSQATGYASHSEGEYTTAGGYASHAEGGYTEALLDYAHSEGEGAIASGRASHAEGESTIASGDYSHAEGSSSSASGYASHAEGSSQATGGYAHSEGDSTLASGYASHAEGKDNIANADYSHAEGTLSLASNLASHAEGWDTEASGESSHSEGEKTSASANQSHAEGLGTIAKNIASHAGGKYNIGTSNDTIREVGIGTSNLNKKNGFEIYLDGTLTAPEATISLINSRGSKALLTKEYGDSAYLTGATGPTGAAGVDGVDGATGATGISEDRIDQNVVSLGNISGAAVFDMSKSNIDLNLTGDITSVSFTNNPPSNIRTTSIIAMTQDTTPRTINWNGSGVVPQYGENSTTLQPNGIAGSVSQYWLRWNGSAWEIQLVEIGVAI